MTAATPRATISADGLNQVRGAVDGLPQHGGRLPQWAKTGAAEPADELTEGSMAAKVRQQSV